MREIKFRGREVDTGRVVYGYYFESATTSWIRDNETKTYVQVDPDSVAQLIGHDTNGAEIYEGDIYFDVDTQTQTHAPCIDELVNEALGDNFVSLDYYEIERAMNRHKKTLVEAE